MEKFVLRAKEVPGAHVPHGDLKDLVRTIDALPGVRVSNSIMGKDKESTRVFIVFDKTSWVKDERGVGLFVLARCVDKRYSKGNWVLRLGVSDRMEDNVLPTSIVLDEIGDSGKEVEHIKDLIDNLNHHANHEAFLEGYKIDPQYFEKVFAEKATATATATA